MGEDLNGLVSLREIGVDGRKKAGKTPDGNEFVKLSDRRQRAYYRAMNGMGSIHDAILKYEHPDTYRLSDAYIESVIEDQPLVPLSSEERLAYRPPANKLVGAGAWVLILHTPPVEAHIQPVRWGIYWAVPCHGSKNYDGYDPYGKYKVDVQVPSTEFESTSETVGLFPHEYMIMADGILKEELDDGHYTVHTLSNSQGNETMSLELIERGRSLTEDERAIIWSLQVDGLPELQACQEYFFSRHTSEENVSIWYNPVPELVEYYDDLFGDVGKPLEPRKRA